ncbi:hypothetical protein CPB84DRAFT_1815723 [Gymnopilus junonius]|uniref:VWFA domain-containing protein n=1 Tax=Gymnopilus junonius TaxID=109634 RepID=A0A9P5NP41_GYMJU|nr:hypothetical protein CPB84DRAFT_1815723 [Gymnopilus junonius]
MSLADDKFLPSGTYAIINAECNRSLNFDEEDDRLSATSDDYTVSYGNCINLIRICRTINGALEKQDLVSRWDTAGKAMTSMEVIRILGYSCHRGRFRSYYRSFPLPKPGQKRPSRLPGFKDLSTSLRVIANSRPKDMKSFPDSQMFTIFDESLGTTGSGQSLNAIITIHSNPGKPDPGTVNEGYNEELDRPRPSFMDDWLEKYRAIFIVDDSSAMINSGAWVKAKDAVFRVATEVMQYDANGISVYFLNSLLYQDVVTSPGDVEQIFSQVEPQGASPIGARLEFVLNKVTDQLEQAKNSASEYSQIKPIHIVVLTNSPSSDNVAKVIRFASRKLNDGLHHPNAVSIQFVQVGNDDGAEKALKKLSEDPSFNIVDSVSLGTKFSPETLQKAVLGTMHPSVRAKVASTSGSQLRQYKLCQPPLEALWLGPTADDYVRFKYTTQPIIPPFVEGAQYRVLNRQTNRALVLNTGVSPGRDLYLFDSTFTLKRRDDGGVALHSTRTGTYVGPNFMSSATEVSLYVISSTSNPGFFFICADRDHRQAFFDPEVDITHNGAFRLDLGNFDKDNTRQMWSLFAL